MKDCDQALLSASVCAWLACQAPSPLGPEATRAVAPPVGAKVARELERPLLPKVAPAVVPQVAPPVADAKDWNDAQIAWRGYDDGLSLAKLKQKPVLLVFYTTWCPHCTGYSRVFADPSLIAAAQDFIMVRLDSDAQRELSQRYSADGSYVPRTYFLRPSGELMASVKAKDAGPFQYFYDEADPQALLSGMQRAKLAMGSP